VVENAAAHYVHNRGPGRSINLSAFSNDKPGTQLSAQTLFVCNDTIVQDAIQVTHAKHKNDHDPNLLLKIL